MAPLLLWMALFSPGQASASSATSSPAPLSAADCRNIATGVVVADSAGLESGFYDMSGMIQDPQTGYIMVNLRHNHCSGRTPCTEGMAGEMEYSTMSSDSGATWASLRSLEPSNTLASHASGLIPAPQGTPNFGRVYALYDYNLHNVTHMPNGKKCSRTDDLGEFVMRYTKNAGRTWSSGRWVVPYRLTSIDLKNEFKGAVKLMECHTKALVLGRTAYVAFSKYGKCCGQNAPGSGWLLYSDNIFSAEPANVTWQLLPRGDKGIRAPVAGRAEEHFVVPVGSTSTGARIAGGASRMLVVL